MIEHLHLAELGLKGVEQDCGVEVSVRVVFTDDAVVVYSDCVHGDFSLNGCEFFELIRHGLIRHLLACPRTFVSSNALDYCALTLDRKDFESGFVIAPDFGVAPYDLVWFEHGDFSFRKE